MGCRAFALRGLPVAPRVFRAPSGPAAREIATREPAARSGRSRSPPVPSGPSGALHTSGARLLMLLGASPRSPPWPHRRPPAPRPCPRVPPAPSTPVAPCCCVWLSASFEARPGPAAAHQHRGHAHGSLRCSPHQWRLVADVARRVASKPGQSPPPPTGTAAMPHRRPRAPRPCPTAAHQHRGHAPPQLRVSCSALACGMAEAMPNFARNSPATISNLEFKSLEL